MAVSVGRVRESKGYIKFWLLSHNTLRGGAGGSVLNAELAVLSACNTASGSGEEDRGEGFAGLTRSFMYAGARSLLVTQWSVETSSARRLVEATFSGLKQGRAKTLALAVAKRDFIGSDRLIQFGPDLRVSEAHPFFWAPYILVGEVH